MDGVQDTTRLQEIAADLYGGRIERDAARARVCEVVLDRLQCARVSLWRFEADDRQLVLQCVGARRAGGPFEKDETRLLVEEYRAYFDVLAEHGTFVADDAMAEAALQAMREKYLLAFGVVSMLDAAFSLNGRAYGVICCEEMQPRHWRPSDVRAVRTLATRLALLMASYDDPELWRGPSLLLQPAETAPRDRRR